MKCTIYEEIGTNFYYKTDEVYEKKLVLSCIEKKCPAKLIVTPTSKVKRAFHKHIQNKKSELKKYEKDYYEPKPKSKMGKTNKKSIAYNINFKSPKNRHQPDYDSFK